MTERVNVLLLITELNIGGAETVVRQLATLLSHDRYRVTVACLFDPEAVGATIRAAGIRVIDLAMRGKWDLRALPRLWRLLRDRDTQILHAHLFHANLLAAVCGVFARVPVVIATRHNVDIGGRPREFINRWARKACDAVVAISAEVYEAEQQHSHTSAHKMVLIPNGVEVEALGKADSGMVEELRQAWGIDDRTRVVGTLARLHEQKGHAYLFAAAAEIRRQIPGFKALVVGAGPLRAQLEERAEALGLANSVVFTGIRRDVPEVLALLDVFVLPSLWEGLPIALLEAMAAGLPIVATRVGGVPEAVVDGVTGLLVPPRDPEALAAAISRLLRDPELGQRMGQAGQARIRERFSVDRMVRETEALYERLLREKGLT